MRLGKIFNGVFFLYALADVFHPQIMRRCVISRVKLAKGHLEIVRHLINVRHADSAPIGDIAWGAYAVVKAGIIPPPLRRRNDLVGQAVQNNLQDISSTVVHSRAVGGAFKGCAVILEELKRLAGERLHRAGRGGKDLNKDLDKVIVDLE